MQVITECNLAELVVRLLQGDTVVFPTETSYGLGCDATNQAAVDEIFKIKGRPSNKPLLIVVPSIAEAAKYLAWNDNVDKIAKKYWPGAVTVVGRAVNDSLATGVVGTDGTVALRVTSNGLLKSLTEKMGRPLVATSANLSDQGDSYNGDRVVAQFADKNDQPDIILNSGELPKNLPSTLVSIIGEEIKILRQGEMKIEI